jgi:hypothetical protein
VGIDPGGQEKDFFCGIATLYERQADGTWRELRRLNSATAKPGIVFGGLMAMSEGYIGVSAMNVEDEDEAAVEVFAQ